jgi:hypothetical protein
VKRTGVPGGRNSLGKDQEEGPGLFVDLAVQGRGGSSECAQMGRKGLQQKP